MRAILSRDTVVQFAADVKVAKSLLRPVTNDETPPLNDLKEIYSRLVYIDELAKKLLVKLGIKPKLVKRRHTSIFWWCADNNVYGDDMKG